MKKDNFFAYLRDLQPWSVPLLQHLYDSICCIKNLTPKSFSGTVLQLIDGAAAALTHDQFRDSYVVGLRIHYVDAKDCVAIGSFKAMIDVQVSQQIKPADAVAPYWSHTHDMVQN